jgi:hypothetical protein
MDSGVIWDNEDRFSAVKEQQRALAIEALRKADMWVVTTWMDGDNFIETKSMFPSTDLEQIIRHLRNLAIRWVSREQ